MNCRCDWETGECQATIGCKAVAEIERLRRGLNTIAQAGTVYGGVWCVAQALGHLHDLDFDQWPETGKPPIDGQ